MNTNNYDELSDEYLKTHEKPDKKYSMGPTILKILGPIENKICIDVGCGDGFFTKKIAEKSKYVIGIDSSIKQIEKATKSSSKNIEYSYEDMFSYNYPKSDIILATFVINYLQSKDEILSLFEKFYESLSENGKFVGIIDNPRSKIHDSKKFGVIKRIDELKEGNKISIELYNKDDHIITLSSFFHTKETIEECLKHVGFKSIKWHNPIISEQGIKDMGESFWKNYVEGCDLAYFSATK